MPLQHSEQRALQVLRATNRALERNSREQPLLDDICRLVIEEVGYDLSWIGYTVDDAERSLRFVAHAGLQAEYLKEIRVGWGDNDIGRGPAGTAIKSGQPYVLRHVENNPIFGPWRDKARKYGFHSAIALPLAWQGEKYGCLTILSSEDDAFDLAEASLLGELAASLSYGIHAMRADAMRAGSEQELRAERDTQEVLRKILTLSLESIPLEDKLNRALELLFNVPWLALERKGSVFLVDEQSTTLRLVAKRYLSPYLTEHCAHVAFGHCLCGLAASSGELIFRPHVTSEHHTTFDNISDHGHYCQPIQSSKGLLGVLNLYVAAGHQPGALEAPFLGAIGDALAGLIDLEQMRMAQQRLITILDATPDLVTITDPAGNFLYCNEGARHALVGCSQRGGTPASIRDELPVAVASLLLNTAYPAAQSAGIWEGELNLITPDGMPLPVSQLVIAHRPGPDSPVAYYSTVARDISDRKRAEVSAQSAALREKHFANSLINTLPGIFVLVNSEGLLLRWNSNLEQALGYRSKQLHGMTLQQFTVAEERATISRFCSDTCEHGSATAEISLRGLDGRHVPYYVHGARIELGEGETATVLTGIDISYRLQLKNELRARATTDALTGAYNRLKMEEALEYEIMRHGRHHTPLSLIMFDVDHFKRVNDQYGHDTGDLVLKEIVALARQHLRETDVLARWGGEEFMVLSPATTQVDIRTVAERLRQAVAGQPIDGVGQITVSLGVGELRRGETMKTLIKRVDDALYQAKNNGRNQTQLAE